MQHTYERPEFSHFTPRFKKRMAAHDKQHNDTPFGRNFATWNKPNYAKDQNSLRKNFDSIFPNAPGAGI